MFERLLIAVDGSDCATRAVTYGVGVATHYDAEVEFAAVYDGNAERGEAVLAAAADIAAEHGVEAETTLLSGKPGRTIARHASDSGADLVVVGRTGRSGVAQRLLGSVTERVLRRSEVPVLTVPDSDAVSADGDVLVTTDGSDLAAGAGPYAADLARHFEASLHVLNAVDVYSEAGVFDAGGVSKDYIERLEAKGAEAVDDLLAGLDTSDLDVREAVIRGAAARTIADYTEDNDIGLLVMSSEGQSNLTGQRLGTVAGRVLRTVDRPVLVITSR